MNAREISSRRRSRGFGMAYAITVLALLSLTAMAVARFSNQSADSKRMAETRDELVTQVSLIRSKLMSCALTYPGGDPTTFDPIPPATGPSGVPITTINCPGDPAASKQLWKPADGVFAPRSLTGLTDWVFIRNAVSPTAVTLSISQLSGGNPVNAAWQNAALRFGAQGHYVSSTSTLNIDFSN